LKDDRPNKLNSGRETGEKPRWEGGELSSTRNKKEIPTGGDGRVSINNDISFEMGGVRREHPGNLPVWGDS